MKRTIALLILAGFSLPAIAQKQQVTTVDTAAARAFYATEEWDKAFMGHYGVNPGIEPGLPDNDAERVVLGQVRTFLQTGTDADINAAVQAIDTLVSTQQNSGVNTSPMMLFVAGTLKLQQAEIINDEAQSARILDQAETYLKRAVDPSTGFPNFMRAHKNLANLLWRREKAAEAKTHFIKAIELGDNAAVTYGLLGAIYMEEGNLISAEMALKNSLMINPTILEFKQLLGNALLQQERYSEAKEIYAELLIRRPNEVNYWMAQANCYIALDEIEQASTNLEIVRLMGQANVASLMLLGDVYINKEMIDEATEAYLEAIRLEPSASNLNNFIRAAETLNNYVAYEQGMMLIETINELYGDSLTDENEIDLLSLASEINISLGKGEEAAISLEALLRKDPFNARALLSLASYYGDLEADESLPSEDQDLARRRNQQQAFIYYERAQELDDDRTKVRAYIGEAQLRVQRDELGEAADLLENAQSITYQETVQAYLEQIRAALRNRRRS